ncbi:MAG: NAD-dependent epimerase/dehydratase family protein [Alphaproteobacteria bacterium]|nr:NAD-dependent epimerase/dehydratase family protein [Alphaproteobacteria bacterium]
MSVVLLTGATTPLGERLASRLLADPRVEQVLGVALEAPARGPTLEDPRFLYRPLDLSRSRSAHDLLFGEARELGVDVVVHAAFHRSTRARGRRAHRHNVDALRTLLELCERQPQIRRFVLRSFAQIYTVDFNLPALIGEDHPVDLSPGAPQWVRDRVEADLSACVQMGRSTLDICVLRCAEILSPGEGSQLYDYLEGPICLRPAGYDPMLNLLSLDDAAEALALAALAEGVEGVFNVPGADTLPLSELIRRWGRVGVPLPGALLAPLYRARSRLRGHEFSYGMMRQRLHYSGVPDGARAREELGFRPGRAIEWPRP